MQTVSDAGSGQMCGTVMGHVAHAIPVLTWLTCSTNRSRARPCAGLRQVTWQVAQRVHAALEEKKRAKVTLRTEVAEKLRLVEGDPARLQQVRRP